MADDLDQGYMQTRQTMRDWQNRMLFMETTQEGNQVHLGVQVGGKETDGKGVAPTAQPQPEAPVTLAPDATLPPEQPQAQQPNTITVDTPEVAAVKQQFSAHMQEVASGEAGMKALGKGGKALAEAARPGFETAAIALGMDEEAAATVGQAFVEFMGGLPSDDSTDLQAGFETAIAVLPAVGAMYKSGKMVGKAAVEGLTKNRDAIIQEFRKAGDILKSERGSVPLGGGVAGQPPDVPLVNSLGKLPEGPTPITEINDMGFRIGRHSKALRAQGLPVDDLLAGRMTPEQMNASESLTQKAHELVELQRSRQALIVRYGLDAIEAKATVIGGKATRHPDEISREIDAFYDDLQKRGIDIDKFYDPTDPEMVAIYKGISGWRPLPPHVTALYQEHAEAVIAHPGGAGKPPDVPPVNIGGAAEEPISPKALSTISRREQAKSDFAIKVAGFKEALTKQRRGPVLSDEAVRKLAGESGFTLQDLLDLKPGSILAPEIQVAARDVFKASADKMKASAKAYLERADPQAFDEFAQAFAEAGIATTRIIGTFAEGGRTFRLFNQKYPTLKTGVKPDGKDPEFSIQDQYIQEMYKFFRGVEEKSAMGGFEGARGGAAQPGMVSPAQLAQMVMDLPNEEAMMKFAKEAVKPTWGDMMMEVWINGLLSGPITHSTNIISNAATVAWNIPERAVASMLSPKAVRPGEAAAMLGGVVESMGDAWRLAWKAFKEEQPQFGQSKLEMPRRAITADALEVTGMTGRAVDFLGAAVRLPGRFLMAGDDFFKAIAFRAELRALAKRQAFREINEMSLTGKAAAQKAKEIEKNILDNPPDSIKEAAQEFAAYTTFTRDLGETGQKVQALASTPIGRIVMPFVRTPTNIFKFAGERTPLALASRAVREEIAAGGERRALALAKIGLGSMTMAYMSTLAANGLITGGGPKDKALRQIKMQTGWKPYSFKIGNEYISYARIEPLGSLFGLAADAADIMGQLSEADAAKLASALTVAISRNVAQKTFVKGLAGTLSAVTSQEVKQVNSFLEKELPTILPYSSALGQTAKNVDPVMREVNSIMDAFKAKIPGYSSDLPPHRNLWGEPVLLEGGLGPDLLSPFYSSTMKDDKVAAELDRLQAPITLPSKQIDRVPLTPKQYDRYQILAAHPQGMPSLREKLEEVIASDLYRHGTDDPADGGKITLLKMWVNNYRDLAKFQLRQEDADLDAKLRERETKKAGAFAGTAPGGLSR